MGIGQASPSCSLTQRRPRPTCQQTYPQIDTMASALIIKLSDGIEPANISNISKFIFEVVILSNELFSYSILIIQLIERCPPGVFRGKGVELVNKTRKHEVQHS